MDLRAQLTGVVSKMPSKLLQCAPSVTVTLGFHPEGGRRRLPTKPNFYHFTTRPKDNLCIMGMGGRIGGRQKELTPGVYLQPINPHGIF